MSESNTEPIAGAGRRWTILAAGVLLAALAVVVIYTGRGAFRSPLALVVVAAIGLAALLVQLQLRRQSGVSVRAPLWLNVLAILLAVVAVVADIFDLNEGLLFASALGAVLCFGVSGIVVFGTLRKRRIGLNR